MNYLGEYKETLQEEFSVEEETEEMCGMIAEQMNFMQSAAGFINASCTFALKVGLGGASMPCP